MKKRVRFNNPILHFWASYMVILIVPLTLISIGFMLEYRAVRADINESNLSKMAHSVQLIDNELDAVEAIALQVVNETSVEQAALLDDRSGESMLKYKKSIDTISTLLQYRGLNLLKETYFYFSRQGYVIYDTALYREELFYEKLSEMRVDVEDWKREIADENALTKKYVSCANQYLEFAMPIQVQGNRTNLGMAVFRLNVSKILDYFAFAEDYGDWAVYVLDEDNNVILFRDYLEERETDFSGELSEDMFPGTASDNLLCVSSQRGWKYYLILPENVVAGRVVFMRRAAAALGVGALILGAVISCVLAIRESRPLNHLFSILGEEEGKEKNYERLGEVFSEVLSDKQAIWEEWEASRPTLRKGFLHDLITLDVTSTKEIDYLAKNTGISLEGRRLRVISVRLYENNDLYDVDEQTLQNVKIIFRNLQSYMEEKAGEDIWFYQRNYLSMLVMLTDDGDVKRFVQDAHDWLKTTFYAEADFGIATSCDSLINIWKYCAEAETAMKHCNVVEHIVFYGEYQEEPGAMYFPDTAQRWLENGLRSGDREAVESVLAILERENYENRKLSRNGFIKLNAALTGVLSHFENRDVQVQEDIIRLNGILVERERFSVREYFQALREICFGLCERVKGRKSQQKGELVERIREYIEQNYQDSGLGLANVSVAFQISEGYISMLFREQLGMGFAEYVEKLRLERAGELLKQKEKTIEEIALMVGYNSVHSFRRAFKRAMGVSPKEYR